VSSACRPRLTFRVSTKLSSAAKLTHDHLAGVHYLANVTVAMKRA